MLDSLSLRVTPGVLVLAWVPGCGKSTLLKLASGALLPDDGRVWLVPDDLHDTPLFAYDVRSTGR